ncbi:MAG: hypothetical protein U5K54_04390 [Cytophagales bacterium]|nr:hypothetical protein [Cytophagales bacterium]
MLIVTDLELYKQWESRINTTPLMYMESEAVSSVNPIIFVTLLLILFLLLVAFLYLYWKKLAPSLLQLPTLSKKWAPVWLIITGLLIIPIRSSFSVAPLNTGVVYFHKSKAFPNHAGINPVWNFFKSLTSRGEIRYPQTFYNSDQLDNEFTQLMQPKHSSMDLLSTQTKHTANHSRRLYIENN